MIRSDFTKPLFVFLIVAGFAAAMIILPGAGSVDGGPATVGQSPGAAVTGASVADDMVVKKSAHGVSETLDRLQAALEERGATVFARIDHAAGAASIGQTLRPTELLIFGNPRLGTPLIQSAQPIALDLPMKALAFEDEKGDVYLAYVPFQTLAGRHGITGQAELIARGTGALDEFSDHATQ